ncbi:elongator complex protein 1 isoform X2 [Cimex lectularius]|uniref:Elongator complex protein 1 n=1 Tax=Cimex lectularius TaxID=79782 RepID=A0A8I6S003_CIMLE|nr:elongator complex protein 1 isoform X2 [Cimex lectularius]
MKNLRLFLNVSRRIEEFGEGDLKIIGTSIRAEGPESLFIFHRNRLYSLILPNLELQDVKNDFTLLHLSGKESDVVGSIYNEIFGEIHLVYASGVVLTLMIQDGEVLSENANFIVEGITCVKWSPNLEQAAVLVKTDRLLIINSSFEVLNSVDLQSLDEGERKSVSVGWGKKETQFKGSAGKKEIKEETVEQSEIKNDLSTSITWRGDSDLFAVNYWCNSFNKRRIKIFDKEGNLQSIGEDLPGLETPMCWRPLGNLIAFCQRFMNRYVIGFMEKNGLKHGDFNLSKDVQVISIDWNVASNIILVVTVTKKSDYLLSLWTTGNYHWYLKQSFKFSQKPILVSWDEQKETRLFVVTDDKIFHVLEFTWVVDHSTYKQPESSYISVIDDDKLLLTPFNTAIIPPPMCCWSLNCDSSINQILYCPDFKQGCDNWFLCAVCSNNKICFFEIVDGNPSLSKIFDMPFDNNKLDNKSILGIWEWLTNNMLVCCNTNSKTGFSDIAFIKVEADGLFLKEIVRLEKMIIAVIRKDDQALLQTVDNEFIKCNIEFNDNLPIISLPEQVSSTVIVDNFIYALSNTKHLYVNEKQIAANITSFFVKKPYILATTTHHTLLILKTLDETCEEVSLRKLERGSKIILVTGNSVVMQHPRGNLETIQPRALTILAIGSLLDKQCYNDAVHLLRKQRITFDLCVDHDPEMFLENVDKFVDQVDQQWITLMVTELSEKDVTKGVYSAYYIRDSHVTLTDKIDIVCNAILEALSRQNDNKNSLAKLSCLVKLKKIGKAIELANDPSSLQHLLFLVDVESLYKEALGTYNLNAALKIAEKSQMDPKEYVPYLNSLKDLEINYMKYTIDRTLKRPKSALNHISKCGEEKMDECYILIKEYNLYSQALELFKNDVQRYVLVASMFGESLYKKRHFEEAGIMFARANKLEKAIEAFTKSGNWRQCIILSRQCNFSDDDVRRLGESLYNGLISSEEYREAGNVALECLHDVEKCIDAFLLGKYWQEAIFEVLKHNKIKLIDVIKQNVLDNGVFILDDFSTKHNTIKKYVDRLEIVRKEKANKPRFHDFDEMSDTSSSVSSFRTNPSFVSRSSKMTRKMSRKLWSLKEGNPREEEALIATLGELIPNMEKNAGSKRR